MFKKMLTTATAGAVMSLSAMSANADGHAITVGYFLEWPMPFQFAKVEGLYEDALGVPVNWVSFDTGTAMSAAMASGDVQISVSQGVTPFLVATAAGQDLTVVDIAVTYSDNDNCVVRSDLEIDASNVKDLVGKEVAVPLGTAAHSGFLAQMKHFGIDPASMTVVDMAPEQSAAAFASGNFDMVCGWGGALRRMKEYGNVIISGAEKEAVVGKVFDVTSVPTGWAQENSEVLSKFLGVTAKANAMYAADRAPMIATIASDSGMDEEATVAVLDVFGFPTVDTQLGDDWFASYLPTQLAASAAALEEAGQIKALDDYSGLVDSSYLAASK